MKITLNKVIPAPLLISGFPGGLWDAEIQLQSPEKYLIKAFSGKGKTTLIHLIYGMRNDYTGNIQFDGKNIRSNSLDAWSKIRQSSLSVVFQTLNLFPGLTALENIMIKYRLGSPLNTGAIEVMAEKLDIGGKLNQKCEKLSLGQQQRVAIIRALVPSFKFLLLDEPFSHLDHENTVLARELITSRCGEEGAGLILTSLNDDYGFGFDRVYEI